VVREGQKRRRKALPDKAEGEGVASESTQEPLRNETPSDSENVLTSIPLRIHCSATTDVEGSDELDEIDLENFLDTLAQVALRIASRKLASHRQQGGEVG